MVSRYVKGQARTQAEEETTGLRVRAKRGKDPMPFAVYDAVAMYLLTKQKDPFAHCFMLMTWNLMCRTNNTCNILISSMQMADDALQVRFSQCKNDQVGEKKFKPRHVYANPTAPHLCPILGLGLLLVVNKADLAVLSGRPAHGPTSEEMPAPKLFPSESREAQKQRFNKLLRKAMLEEEIFRILAERGTTPEHVTAHSLRKGAATMCSGVIGGPNAFSICVRGGWSIGDVLDRYVTMENGTDQFIGRILAGLPHDSPEFATLLPHFDLGVDRDQLDMVMIRTFGVDATEGTLVGLLRACLASLVLHRDWLLRHLHVGHLARSTWLFSNPLAATFVNHLKGHIAYGVSPPNAVVRPTGVPPAVRQMLQAKSNFEELLRHVGGVLEAVQDLPEQLAQRNMPHGQVAALASMQSAVERVEAIARDLAHQRQRAGPVDADAGAPAPAADVLPSSIAMPHQYDGKFWAAPRNYTMPRARVADGWQLWWCGSANPPLSPLRLLTPSHLALGARKRFYDWRDLFSSMETHGRQQEGWREPRNAEDVQRLFSLAYGVLGGSVGTKRNRPDQAMVTTAHKHLRGLRKRRRAADESPEQGADDTHSEGE